MYIIAIFTIISILFTFTKIAEVVTEVVQKVSGVSIPVPLFQTVSANFAMIGGGLFLFILAGVIAIPVIKVAMVIVGIAMIGIALRNVFRTFSGRAGESPLPSDLTKK